MSCIVEEGTVFVDPDFWLGDKIRWSERFCGVVNLSRNRIESEEAAEECRAALELAIRFLPSFGDWIPATKGEDPWAR